MGMDIEMVEKPTKAEIQAAKLDAESPGYWRFNVSGMSAMVVVMDVAGLMSSENHPEFPAWPPAAAPAARRDVLAAAASDPKLEAKLTSAEKLSLERSRARFDEILKLRSIALNHVPAYKFGSNEGWLLTSDECVLIATKLHAYAKSATQADLDRADKAYRARQAALEATIGKSDPGMISLVGQSGLDMALADYKQWIEQWATYNEVAAKHHGYKVY